MRNDVEELDYLILKAISFGYRTPEAISRELNIDRNSVKERIRLLTREGYLSERVKLTEKGFLVLEKELLMRARALGPRPTLITLAAGIDRFIKRILMLIARLLRGGIRRILVGMAYGVGFFLSPIMVLVVALLLLLIIGALI
ncbi:MAG: hypothetical protein OD815_001279 [Candidatus Alkanophagales archaeon MCA70_species_2]|nr:hypothetical protein [Candidatus Alkanophaga liquidiphilum]